MHEELSSSAHPYSSDGRLFHHLQLSKSTYRWYYGSYVLLLESEIYEQLHPSSLLLDTLAQSGAAMTTKKTPIHVVVLQDVEYIVKNSAKWREKISILSKVSGSIPPGYLTALVSPILTRFPVVLCQALLRMHATISLYSRALLAMLCNCGSILQMGPSGSGKTTLLGKPPLVPFPLAHPDAQRCAALHILPDSKLAHAAQIR